MGVLNKDKTETGNYLTLCVTYNKILPNIKSILEKDWHILNVNPELKKVFESKPLLAFHKYKNLKQLIGGNTVEKNTKLLTTKKFTNRKCSPCFSNSGTLFCKQVIKTEHFKNNQTNRAFRIFQKTTCKSNFIIYLLECELCKIHYVVCIPTILGNPVDSGRIPSSSKKILMSRTRKILLINRSVIYSCSQCCDIIF